MRRPPWVTVAAVLAGLFILTLLPILWRARPRLTTEEARAIVTTTLQREVREAFVVTGALEMTATTRVENVRRLLGVSIGTIESQVRAPGRVSYGFPIAALRAEDIEVRGDTIELRVPAPAIYAVEPLLEQMEVETRTGWLRVREATQLDVQQRAVELIAPALRSQAEQHLRDSEQPRIHTAETLHDLLRPAFVAAGVREPVFRFIIDDRLILRGPG